MNIRNAKYNEHGTVNCEIDHPKFGWIPFTASPDDPEESGRAIYAAAKAGEFGNIEAYKPHVPTPEEIQAKINRSREEQKEILRNKKLDEMLALEFAEIDSAKTEQAIKQIKLRG